MTAQLCTIDGCGRRADARGWCKKHYQRWVTNGDPLATKQRPACAVDGCNTAVNKDAHYCAVHEERYLRTGDPEKSGWLCATDGCNEVVNRGGNDICPLHRANPWAGRVACLDCGSARYTLPFDQATSAKWICVACHLWFTPVAEQKTVAA